jgi:DNA-directed RNA polymerase specialized sigma24 family protein
MLATDVRELSHNGNSLTGADASLAMHSDHSTDSDEVLKALSELDAVLKENSERERMLFQRIADVRLARENGRDWKAILADEDEPSTVQLVSTILRRQSEASGYLRRSLVVALRAEGQSIPSIAHLFGVTHQRVSNLLRRVAQGGSLPSE